LNVRGIIEKPVTEGKKIDIPNIPRMWIGFIFAGISFFFEYIEYILGTWSSILFGLIVGIYWFHSIHRIHSILEAFSSKDYPISPKHAVVGHFLPFFNIYWFIKWPHEFTKYISLNSTIKIIPGSILGFLLLISFIVNRTFDGTIGILGIFTIGTYLVNKLRKLIEG